MKAKTLYLFICFLGTALPYWQFIPWVVAHHGIPLSLFFRELFADRVSAFFGMDVFASAVALVVFMRVEARRLRINNLWLVLPALLLVGVSLGMPLFLYLRELSLERGGAISASSPTSGSQQHVAG